MNNINERLDMIQDVKDNIKIAIEEKGQTVGNIPFDEYPSRIKAITTSNGDEHIFPPEEGSISESNTVSAKYTILDTEDYYSEIEIYSSNGTFNQLSQILESGVFSSSGVVEMAKKVKLINAKKTNVTFSGMRELEEIEGLETVETLEQQTFRDCGNLYLDGSFPNVKYASSSFANYSNLPASVNFPKLKQTGYSLLMSSCTRVNSVTFGSPGFPFKTAGAQMFNGCSFIKQVIIYVENPSNPGLTGAPWGATNATITYKQA